MDRRLLLLKKELQGTITDKERAELKELQRRFNELAKDIDRWYEWLKSKS